ncbi:bacteriohemerythrin [Magnetospirillum moscoviense]|uniref:Cyclic nucleotide-binding protein n=1 Tax=Magnetospirillum moscoviense TaxID=1437059 RepID=A0A178MDB2_9PROT|nr:bacteriohemerythrin [Magnetospirillum moscoviense]OAN46800.1 cyclic nucleotide-binding protein [Magnetospirillum moscoviense]
MSSLRKIEVTTGVWWVECPSADLRVLCGCPADVVKHLMKRGLIASTERGGITYETGPSAILLSDVMVQNGSFANLGEFPVLQMLYRQGMLLPNHPGNTGAKPLLIGSAEQVRAQLQYIYRGNYGLISEEELIDAGATPETARELMRMKLKFAFGSIRHPGELLDSLVVENDPVPVKNGVTIKRVRLNVFEFRHGDETVLVDLNLPPFETYECPYPLGFYNMPREYFSVVHSGEGDGWDINRPAMGSILMFQGRVFLIDAGPNILSTLDALGIGVNEIEGIFHTHSHDDHFAGLTTLIRADHRIKYYATPLVRASVARKIAALLSIEPSAFADYFECHDLVEDEWTDIEGLEIKPVFSPHPVETTIFQFRTPWEDGYRTYAHFADICRLEVLKGFVTDDDSKPGISAATYDRVAKAYAVPAQVKKVDVGGGLIHGDANDFREDKSGKVILAHTALKHTVAQKAIGSTASFGTVDTLIPSNHDFIWRSAYDLLMSYFPDIAHHQIRVLLNNPVVTFNPGTILVKERAPAEAVFLLLSGSVEALHIDGGSRSVLSAGAMIGELAALLESEMTETYRAIGFVKALRIAAPFYREFVRRNELLASITRIFENRQFLQRTWLFGEVVSTRTLNRIAKDMTLTRFQMGEVVDIGPESVALVVGGAVGRYLGDHCVETLVSGDFFGEELAIFWTPSMFRLRALIATDAYLLPAGLLAGIPSVRWKLFEASGKRMSAIFESGTAGRVLLQWHDDYRVDVVRLDTQHRRLFEQANAILDAIESGRGVAEVQSLMSAMIEYARYHFGEEEALMLRHQYPETDAHRGRHAALISQLESLKVEVEAADSPQDIDLLPVLKEWLVSHILTEDRRYSGFLNAKGVF